jgi:hypothetical protein
MQKAQILASTTQKGQFRLITNPSDFLSVGVVMSRTELTELSYQIRDILDQTEEAPVSDEDEA